MAYAVLKEQCGNNADITFFYFRNVIDVAALDSHNLQQHEYLERTKMYNIKVQQVFANNRQLNRTLNRCILVDIPLPEKILNSEPINPEDLSMVSSRE